MPSATPIKPVQTKGKSFLDTTSRNDVRAAYSILSCPPPTAAQSPAFFASLSVADPDIPFRGVGLVRHEMRLNAKRTVGSFGGQILLYHKIITRKI